MIMLKLDFVFTRLFPSITERSFFAFTSALHAVTFHGKVIIFHTCRSPCLGERSVRKEGSQPTGESSCRPSKMSQFARQSRVAFDTAQALFNVLL